MLVHRPTAVVRDIVAWAQSIGADRVDLGASAQAQPMYERLGFCQTAAPRLKLALSQPR